jgi:hypothetical protein
MNANTEANIISSLDELPFWSARSVMIIKPNPVKKRFKSIGYRVWYGDFQ